ncbi:unnamed protein product [Dibothriocephalus latus]|uniref:Uncharacterized protein n=1 Tax=Dibothriocephalus latus TaxID=60516 RepID=A0A3P6SIQ2_DIBLA|nr:unnamed protein product [Dibothriocephalus latus]
MNQSVVDTLGAAPISGPDERARLIVASSPTQPEKAKPDERGSADMSLSLERQLRPGRILDTAEQENQLEATADANTWTVNSSTTRRKKPDGRTPESPPSPVGSSTN